MRQRFLGKVGFIIFIAVMNMFIPLSIDLYLPAVPSMGEYFQTDASVINLTLISFFFFYAVGILLFGPFSDKYGRKPMLVFGAAIYTIASVGCAISNSVGMLIACRVVQALGGGSITAVATALIKDCFTGALRSKILAIVQAMAVIAPMVAPVVGGIVLLNTSWRGAFVVLAVIGFLNLITSFFFTETLPKEKQFQGSVWGSLGRLFTVGKNKGFLGFLVAFSCLFAPYMAYVAISSYIYVNYFGLSAQQYSIFFALNSCCALLGPVLYIQGNSRLRPKTFAKICLALGIGSGVLMLLFGRLHPVAFLLCFIPFTLTEGAARPFSTGILLEQQSGDTGSASALINAVNTVIGSVGMMLGSLNWPDLVLGLGSVMLCCGLLASLLFLFLLRSKTGVKGLSDV